MSSSSGGAAPSGGAAAAEAPKEEEKKEEEKVPLLVDFIKIYLLTRQLFVLQEESDDDMGFGLFD